LARPLRGVDPVVSLGVGALRREETVWRPVVAPEPGPRFAWVAGDDRPERLARERRQETSLTLAPGVGARLRVAPGLALRTDLRDVLAVGGGTRHHLELSGGISLAR
ncbi:MAG TPA: hypothetical protein VFX98_10395, partial [Longimicrobiaceae bacterium]|nr:hypothetical protein [Longimicrobiaceae bacterium]